MSIQESVRRRPLSAFFVLAYTASWFAWAPLVLSRTGVGWLPIDVPIEYVIPGSYGPLVAALLVRRATTGRWRIGPLMPAWRSFVLGTVVGIAGIVAAFLLIALWLVGGDADQLTWTALAGYPVAALIAVAQAGPLGEEPGWRGLALVDLQARHHPFVATLLLGVIWGAWHLPLFLLPTWTFASIPMYLCMTAALSVTMAVGFNMSGGSLVAAIVLHTVFNGSSRVLGYLLASARPSPPLPLSSDVVIAGAFVVVAAVLVVATRGRLGAPESSPAAASSRKVSA